MRYVQGKSRGTAGGIKIATPIATWFVDNISPDLFYIFTFDYFQVIVGSTYKHERRLLRLTTTFTALWASVHRGLVVNVYPARINEKYQ